MSLPPLASAPVAFRTFMSALSVSPDASSTIVARPPSDGVNMMVRRRGLAAVGNRLRTSDRTIGRALVLVPLTGGRGVGPGDGPGPGPGPGPGLGRGPTVFPSPLPVTRGGSGTFFGSSRYFTVSGSSCADGPGFSGFAASA